MSKKIKCGEFMCKDGVIIKRPGKQLRIPPAPDKFKEKYPESYTIIPPLFQTDFMGSHTFLPSDNYGANMYTRISPENLWQKQILGTYISLKTLYYISQLKKGIKKVCRHIDKMICAIVHEYE